MSKFSKIFKEYKTYDDSQGRGNIEEWKNSFNDQMNINEAEKLIRQENPLSILGFSEMPTKDQLKK